jgi:ubiquinone/menaquinone biosynthesis C-methylase UbiE
MPPDVHVCPASQAGWLSTPLRRLVNDPRRVLNGLVEPGQTVADLGCGPGFFTLPLARMVGDRGRVIAVDLQPAMLAKLQARAERAGLAGRITLHGCEADSLGLSEKIDAALAFYMLHEVPDQRRILNEVRSLLKPGGRFLLVEPRGHVGAAAFARAVEAAVATGMTVAARPRIFFSRAALLRADVRARSSR